jgi:hypothetical protein
VDPIARFAEYAAAFERVVKSDDWSALEPFFTDDAVYEVVGGPPFAARHAGRSAILAGMRASLEGFDRRFATRELEVLEGPALREGGVWMRWRASYKGPGLPELVFDGEETAIFEGDRIRRLEDRIPLEMGSITQHWLVNFGSRLPAAGH